MPHLRHLLAGALAAATLLAGCAAGTPTLAAGGSTLQTVDSGAAAQLVAEREDLVVVDVRTPGEFASGHLAGAVLLDIQDDAFRSQLEALDRDAAYLVYCRSGNRSAQAVRVMAELGFTEVYDAGGFASLAAAGLPVG
jgi:phage shock protein E